MLHQPSPAPAPGICCNAAVAKSRSLGQTEKAIAVPIIFLRVSTKPSFRIHTKDLLQWVRQSFIWSVLTCAARSWCARSSRAHSCYASPATLHLLRFTANVHVGLIGMEACGGSHFLGRALREQRHEVRLIAAQYVKPYVKTNKSDYLDAEAIAEAVA
jgi:hypothetical protein